MTRRAPYRVVKTLNTLWKPGYTSAYYKAALNLATEICEQSYLRRKPVIWANYYLPSEFIYGLGAIPFYPELAAAVAAGLGFSKTFCNVSHALWYSPDFCSFHRCAVGMAREGYLPKPDAIIASSHLCDGGRAFLHNLSGELNCPFFQVDVPYTSSLGAEVYLAQEFLRIAMHVENHLHLAGWRFSKPLEDRMSEAVAESNRARESMRRINELRKRCPSVWTGAESLSYGPFAFLALGSPAAVSFYEALEKSLSWRVSNHRPMVSGQEYRLLWLHFKPYHRNDLVRYLEKEKKAVISFEEISLVFWDEMNPKDPWMGLAGKAMNHYGWGCGQRRVRSILDMVREYGIDGVVHYSHWGCRQSNGMVEVIRQSLKENGIPFLSLDGDCIDPSNAGWGQARTRVDAFIEVLEERHRGAKKAV